VSHGDDHSTVLVPVDVSADETPHGEALGLLRSAEVVLLGYYPVPDQAAPAQVKHQHESEAERRLSEVAEEVDAAAGNLTEVLVFTHDRQETVDRIADEYGCDAVLTVGEAGAVERILVPLRGRENLDRILGLAADLLRDNDASVTLFHSLDDAAERLTDAGIAAERISRRVSEGKDTPAEVAEMGEGFDVLVLGETEPSLRERILGAVPTQIIDETEGSVFVVRKEGPDTTT
jgi:nucleotide-binding universal stress UspA family protein